MQQLVVGLVVALCVAVAARRVYRVLFRRGKSPCAGCPRCHCGSCGVKRVES